ncbi:MAG: CRISPR-associated protein Cas4 [Desulfobulbaceae bacterium DB1]|nr:MAG: CRISPR-associated protein Cas4 [Desulfobulbaceae bacterium DB1]
MKTFTEDELLPLSALQHLLFCPRQCALIHIEQQWEENQFTAQGRLMHERVDQSGRESRKDVRVEYGMPLRSLRLGLIGKADVVEFHRMDSGEGWQPFPVEFKRGKEKKENWDKVQLCAQAVCLEEMLGLAVPAGALFYGKNRRRQDVIFTGELRRETENTALQLHELISAGKTPAPVYSKRCDSCSFYELCLPRILEKKKKVGRYLDQACEVQ